MRLAYADPPYLGCCKLYDHFHGDDGWCWDDPDTHTALLMRLKDEFDGWAYSCNPDNLFDLVPLLPYDMRRRGARPRFASWQKSFAAYKANVRIAYTWEAVIWSPARDSSKDGAPVGRDHLRCPITLRRGFTGAKPAEFNRWVLDLMGYVEGDEVVDLYPGTHGMGETLRTGVLL